VTPPASDERTPLLVSRSSRRQIGSALIAYGVVGTILAILVAGAGLWGAFRLDDTLAAWKPSVWSWLRPWQPLRTRSRASSRRSKPPGQASTSSVA
jgi:hypothetical protein